jgi:alpha-beta hydrolase superfamily lysophospholipase
MSAVDVADGTFPGAGGVSIRTLRVAPPNVRGAVLLSHGYAEHVGRYRDFAAHLAARGLAVAALDHRGHGNSGGARGHCLDFAEFVADLRTLAERMEAWWPGVPRVLFGHSMGGLIAVLYLLEHPETVRAAALSAPALRVPDDRLAVLRTIARLLGRLAPRTGFATKLDESALSRDPAVGRAYVADPLVHRRVTAGFVRALEAAQARARDEAERLRVPLLILQGDADRIVDPAAASALATALRCPHELVVLPGYFHELLNEPAAERQRVVAALEGWFDHWLAEPPAG